MQAIVLQAQAHRHPSKAISCCLSVHLSKVLFKLRFQVPQHLWCKLLCAHEKCCSFNLQLLVESQFTTTLLHDNSVCRVQAKRFYDGHAMPDSLDDLAYIVADKQQYRVAARLLCGLLHPNPSQRYTVDQALNVRHST